jgi:FKBP-type peptidyl-prolyl cis-trans isomerase (trigger factor)
MDTTLSKASPVEYELDLHATADELEPKLKEALNAQRKNMDVQGFRKGKVPLGLVKKMHGEAIGYRVAEQFVQEAFEEEVEETDAIEPLGQPTLVDLDYELDADLQATLRFGVRPEVELDASGRRRPTCCPSKRRPPRTPTTSTSTSSASTRTRTPPSSGTRTRTSPSSSTTIA